MTTGPRSKRGMVLPIVLLLVLALGAVSTSVLVLVRSELLAERGGRRYLARRTAAEDVLFGRTAPGESDTFTRLERDVGGGYVLVEARPNVAGLSTFGVQWVLDPDSVVAGLPAALQTPGTAPERGVEALAECPYSNTRPLVAAPPETVGGGGGGAGSDGDREGAEPRIGPLEVSRLLDLTGPELPASGTLPSDGSPRIFRARGSATVAGGEAAGLLVVRGDLTMAGAARFVGLVVVARALTLRESARIEGIVIAGGPVDISADAGILGCPERAVAALRLPEVPRDHPVSDGALLGRY